ncbi:hypothetical protein D2E25_1846 [Bifidobacterium goeldii]|uniref:Uncharacterized protein n=1 Tax=Bifidobacterium goeldii TaxID=2306975 RepID=A0A430FEU2_9BIFI|nr:hypothetical protein D2E25_1846 [Bifidobacterium goeldii]
MQLGAPRIWCTVFDTAFVTIKYTIAYAIAYTKKQVCIGAHLLAKWEGEDTDATQSNSDDG